MRNLSRRICILISLAFVSLGTYAVDLSKSQVVTLDGSRFEGKTGEHGKKEHHEDTITFEDGRFRSLDCEEWGFGSAPYTVRKDGESYHFEAILQSPNRGTLEWSGTITGDMASASFRWLHERWYWNIDRRYWFKGTRRSD